MIQTLDAPAILPKLSEDIIQELFECGTEVHLTPGEILFAEGDPSYDFFVVLDGAIRITKKVGDGDMVLAIKNERGNFIGELSLLTGGPALADGRAIEESHVLRFEPERFREIIAKCPVLRDILIPVMAQRTQDIENLMRQQDKLAALGKLSAGLAHELNNPAAAGRRAAKQLRSSFETLQLQMLRFQTQQFDSAQQQILQELQRQARNHLAAKVPLSPLEQSDREDTLIDWLEDYDIPNAWEMASTLVTAGFTPERLTAVAQSLGPQNLSEAIIWLEGSLSLNGLIDEVEQSTGRISELVQAIKNYSYMDRAPLQEIDVHEGLENTLTMLHHRLKKGIAVKREYDRSLPIICAYASELNQVWTNLLDNAIDAMEGKGELTIRTSREEDCVLVEIADNGPGIPDVVKARIFEPFFTTKGVGSGTGLGLDICRRIVMNRHHGSIRFDSKPGYTRFQVRLPIDQS